MTPAAMAHATRIAVAALTRPHPPTPWLRASGVDGQVSMDGVTDEMLDILAQVPPRRPVGPLPSLSGGAASSGGLRSGAMGATGRLVEQTDLWPLPPMMGR